MFSRTLSIRTLLISGLATCAVLIAMIGGFGALGEAEVNANTLEIYQGDLIPILRLAQIRQNRAMDAQVLSRVLANKSADLLSTARETLRTNRAADDAAWAAYYPEIASVAERATADAVAEDRRRLDDLHRAALTRFSQGDFDPLHSLDDPAYRAVAQRLTAEIEKLFDENLRQATDSYNHSQVLYRHMMVASVVAVVLGISVAVVLLLVLLRAIARPIQQAVALADAIAAGQLNNGIEALRDDEIGKLTTALGRMDGQLTDIVSKVRQGAEAVGTASRQIAEGNNELSSRAQAQAASLEETAAAMKEMTASVGQNVAQARSASSLAAAALASAQMGQRVNEETVHAMTQIEGSSQQVFDILGVIDEIAFQINLLSLNAAVEAARAGEAGRGFAVVATEIRHLANRSAKAAKDSREVVANANEKVSVGMASVTDSADALMSIHDSIRSSTDLVRNIAQTSGEQALGIEQVNTSVATLDESTQYTAALVEETAAASQALHMQAESLLELVGFFTTAPSCGRPFSDAPSH